MTTPVAKPRGHALSELFGRASGVIIGVIHALPLPGSPEDDGRPVGQSYDRAVSDAEAYAAAGMDGLIVSNHGGRTLDGLPATIDVLPEVAAAVQGRVPLLLDGGIRRGSDILKALALGADAVLVGRPYVFALATVGAIGVAHVLQLLRAELEVAMALTGCADLASIGPQVIWRSTLR